MQQTECKGTKSKAKLLILYRIPFTDNKHPNASSNQLAGGCEFTDLYMRIHLNSSLCREFSERYLTSALS
jgi:hypothetical protein